MKVAQELMKMARLAARGTRIAAALDAIGMTRRNGCPWTFSHAEILKTSRNARTKSSRVLAAEVLARR